MEVTKDNFNDLFPVIEKEIKECEYLSLDCEFSGIGNCYLKLFDTPEERYKRRLDTEMKFDIVQFGLSIFKPENGGEIKCSSYNFYIFKYPVKNSILPDNEMNISSSAFEFLSNNGFDFNKLFKKGITYCNLKEEQELRASLKRMNNELILDEKMTLKKQKLTYEALAKFNEFLKDQKELVLELGPYEKNALNIVKDAIVNADKNRRYSAETSLGLKKDSLNLDIKVNRIKNEINILWKLEIKKNGKERGKNYAFDCDKIADDQIGFSKVIHAIIHNRKPIVGHNVLVDIMHILNQFISPLPPNYDDFKFIAREVFPLIFDTKHISVFLSTLNKQRVKSLADLYEYFKTNYPEFLNNIKLKNSKFNDDKDNELKFHQAGFDSFITGVCFQGLKSLAELSSNKSIYEDLRFKNKFYNAWSFDVPFLTSEINQDAKLDRKNVYFIEFECQPSELEDKIDSTFKDYKIDYLTSTSCFVAILDESNQKMLDFINSNTFHIFTYDNFMKNENLINQNSSKKFETFDWSKKEREFNPQSLTYSSSSSNSITNSSNTPSLNSPSPSLKNSPSSKAQKDNFNGTPKTKRKYVFEEDKDWY